jgi:hypothetical protein
MLAFIRPTALVLLLIQGLVQISFAADNLLLVTIDGLRWQEASRGLDESFIKPDDPQKSALLQQFGSDTTLDAKLSKREKLLPFLWQVVAKEGVVLGDRDTGSTMQVANDRWFSYPGYNELLSGKPDAGIVSNAAIANSNVTFLEWLNQQTAYQDKVAAFASWDAFNAIINDKRSGIMVNSGFQAASWANLSAKAQWLNELQQYTPRPWPNERLDAITFGLAAEYVKSHRPKVIYLALGETDEFAHQDNYPEYLRAAHRNDYFIAQLWTLLQSMDQYRDNTNLIITVDHGRGQTPETWQHHSSAKAVAEYKKVPETAVEAIIGSDQTWLAAMGPDVASAQRMTAQQVFTTQQIAATALALLNVDASSFRHNIAPALPIIKSSD